MNPASYATPAAATDGLGTVSAEMTADELDEAFADWHAQLDAEAIDALSAYQSGGFHAINAFLRSDGRRGPRDPRAAAAMRRLIDAIDGAVASGSVPSDLLTYRGLRSVTAAFGTAVPSDLPGREIDSAAFVSTTIHEGVALRFARERGGAVVRLALPAGSPAAWLPLAGSPPWAPQGELLLPRGTTLHVEDVRRGRSIIVIDARLGH